MLAIVALDGSAGDRDIVAAAAFVLHAGRDDVRLLTVVAPSAIEETRSGARLSGTLPQATGGGRPLSVGESPGPPAEGRDQAVARVRSEKLSYLERLASELLGDIDYQCIVQVGDPADEIVAAAKRLGAGGIAMGTRPRRSRLGSALFGSVAEDVIRRTDVPVLVVKPGAAES